MEPIDALIDALIKRKATKEEAEQAIRDLHRSEPRTWESADISYDQETP